jgi:uncharacterized protein
MVKLGTCVVCKIVGLLVIVGALNWGLVAAFNFNLVETLLGFAPGLVKIAYIVVGISGLIALVSLFKQCPCCKK